MKKFLLLLLLSMLLISCGWQQKYVISGFSPDASFNGTTIYLSLLEDGVLLDSTIIENGQFQLKGKIKEPQIVRLDMAQVIYSVFFLEAGDIKVDMSDLNCAEGTPLNEQLTKLNEEIDIVYMNWAGEMKGLLRQQYKADALEIQEMQILNESLDKYYSIYEKYLTINKENVLGFYILWQAAQEMDDERFEHLYSQVGDFITSDPTKVALINKAR